MYNVKRKRSLYRSIRYVLSFVIFCPLLLLLYNGYLILQPVLVFSDILLSIFLIIIGIAIFVGLFFMFFEIDRLISRNIILFLAVSVNVLHKKIYKAKACALEREIDYDRFFITYVTKNHTWREEVSKEYYDKINDDSRVKVIITDWLDGENDSIDFNVKYIESSQSSH